jgi:hypothetical protein
VSGYVWRTTRIPPFNFSWSQAERRDSGPRRRLPAIPFSNMAIQAIATLGLRTRGFLNTLATSQGAWARFGRSVGHTFGKSFAGSAGQAMGFLAINKLFAPKPQAGGPMGTLENVTGLDPTKRGIRHRMKNALIAGVLGAGALGAMGIRRAMQVKDMSDVSDLSVRDTQEADKAARQNGRSFDDVATALSNLGAARKDAAEGNRELRDTFRAYGVTLQQLQNPQKTNLDLLKQMGAAIEGIKLTPAQRQDLREILGRSGDKLGPTIRAMTRGSNSIMVGEGAANNIERGVNAVRGLASEGQAVAANATGSVLGWGFKFANWAPIKWSRGHLAKIRSSLPLGLSGLGVAAAALNPKSDKGASPDPAAAARAAQEKADKDAKQMYFDKATREAAEMEMDAQKAANDLAFSRLSPAKQEKELRRRLGIHMAEVKGMENSTDPDVQKIRAMHLQQQVAIVEELMKLNSPDPEQADSLARVGGFAQGAGNVSANSTAVQDVINAINKAQQGIVIAINDGGGW